MALTGLTNAERRDIVLPEDSAFKQGASVEEMRESGATVWTIRNLPQAIRTNLQDGMHNMSVDGTMRQRANSTFLEAIRYSLANVYNFHDENKKPILVELVPATAPGVGLIDVVSNSFLDRLPTAIIRSLGKKIMEENAVSEEERKN